MRLVLVFVALLLSLPLSPQGKAEGDMSWTIIGFVWNLSRPMAPGGVIGNPENERVHHARLPGFHDPRRFHLRADACRFFPDQLESDSDFRNHLGLEAVFVDGVFECRRGVFHRGVKLLDRTTRRSSFRGREGEAMFRVACRQNRVFYAVATSNGGYSRVSCGMRISLRR